MDVWAAGRAAAGKVPSGHLSLCTQGEKADSPKDPTGPDICLHQQEWPSEAGVSLCFPIAQGGVCYVTPVPTPRAQSGKQA